jgi:hypothetical protein
MQVSSPQLQPLNNVSLTFSRPLQEQKDGLQQLERRSYCHNVPSHASLIAFDIGQDHECADAEDGDESAD